MLEGEEDTTLQTVPSTSRLALADSLRNAAAGRTLADLEVQQHLENSRLSASSEATARQSLLLVSGQTSEGLCLALVCHCMCQHVGPAAVVTEQVTASMTARSLARMCWPSSTMRGGNICKCSFVLAEMCDLHNAVAS